MVVTGLDRFQFSLPYSDDNLNIRVAMCKTKFHMYAAHTIEVS
jgi:hypothetical protein